MALFNRRDLLSNYRMKYVSIGIALQTETAAINMLKSHAKASLFRKKDIFLSHSYKDARIITALKDEIEDLGFSVYVDWIDDPNMDRESVTRLNAIILRTQMKNSGCLFYATSDSSTKSLWMPWELGYMDAKTEKVAIIPISEERTDSNDYKGLEYLSLYPYVSKSETGLNIHDSKDGFTKFDLWLNK